MHPDGKVTEIHVAELQRAEEIGDQYTNQISCSEIVVAGYDLLLQNALLLAIWMPKCLRLAERADGLIRSNLEGRHTFELLKGKRQKPRYLPLAVPKHTPKPIKRKNEHQS